MFSRSNFPILLPDGKLNPILMEARARGVIFDVGHGEGSFWFRNAVPAYKQGFIPDSMLTDLHLGNFTVLSMTEVMSKFLAMGVPLDDLIRRSTVNPAKEIHRTELGTLSVGAGGGRCGSRSAARGASAISTTVMPGWMENVKLDRAPDHPSGAHPV